MERVVFSEGEARAKVGLRVDTLVDFSGVPKGTAGTVLRADPSGVGFTLGVEWQLADRSQPLVDWFTKNEYERFLRERP